MVKAFLFTPILTVAMVFDTLLARVSESLVMVVDKLTQKTPCCPSRKDRGPSHTGGVLKPTLTALESTWPTAFRLRQA